MLGGLFCVSHRVGLGRVCGEWLRSRTTRASELQVGIWGMTSPQSRACFTLFCGNESGHAAQIHNSPFGSRSRRASIRFPMYVKMVALFWVFGLSTIIPECSLGE